MWHVRFTTVPFKPLLINNLDLQGFNPENFLLVTGCPNKHGNSVTNSISSFQMILWFRIVIPTEIAVICKSFVCYVHILFVYFLTAYTVVLSKTRKLLYTNRVNLSVFTFHLAETLYTSLHIFKPFHEINSSRHNNIIGFEIRYYIAKCITKTISNPSLNSHVFWDTLYFKVWTTCKLKNVALFFTTRLCILLITSFNLEHFETKILLGLFLKFSHLYAFMF